MLPPLYGCEHVPRALSAAIADQHWQPLPLALSVAMLTNIGSLRTGLPCIRDDAYQRCPRTRPAGRCLECAVHVPCPERRPGLQPVRRRGRADQYVDITINAHTRMLTPLAVHMARAFHSALHIITLLCYCVH
jgi:hypothetical protein